MRRLFWLGIGLGAGAAAVIAVSRWARRQADKVSPVAIAREAKGGLLDLSKLVAQSMEEARRAASDAESRAREESRAKGGPPVD